MREVGCGCGACNVLAFGPNRPSSPIATRSPEHRFLNAVRVPIWKLVFHSAGNIGASCCIQCSVPVYLYGLYGHTSKPGLVWNDNDDVISRFLCFEMCECVVLLAMLLLRARALRCNVLVDYWWCVSDPKESLICWLVSDSLLKVTIWAHLVPPGSIWEHLGPSGIICDHLGTPGIVVGPSGTIVNHLGPSGTIWTNLVIAGRESAKWLEKPIKPKKPILDRSCQNTPLVLIYNNTMFYLTNNWFFCLEPIFY